MIGFDVLASDNDAVASDANRNQITWNSPTDKPFNDPSLWGTLELSTDNSFLPILDKEAPTAPGNLTADEAGTTLTWDPSTDNIAVNTYILYDGNIAVDTIYAKATGNSYTYSDLAAGTHTLGVVAGDNYWNKSAKSTVDVEIVTSVEHNAISHFSMFPNPSTGIVNIVTKSSTNATLEVYNMTGKLIMTLDFTKDCQLDLTDANSGLYFIYLKTEDGVQVEKLILQ
jgi:cytoskeletal protein RodZ